MTEKKTAPGAFNIYQALQAVMRDVPGVAKKSVNQHDKYNYASHDAVTEAIRGAFVRHGIVQTVDTLECVLLDGGVVKLLVNVRWTCIDGSFIEGKVGALQPARKGNITAQQFGQALSYAVKCFQFKSLMLLGDPEKDSDAESDSAEPYDSTEPLTDWNGEAVRGYNLDVASAGGEPIDRRGSDPRHLAGAYLARFADCKTELEVGKLNDEVKANWATVRVVTNFADSLVKARRDATNRIRAGY